MDDPHSDCLNQILRMIRLTARGSAFEYNSSTFSFVNGLSYSIINHILLSICIPVIVGTGDRPVSGRSEFAIVVDGKIQVIHDEEYERPYFLDMISEVWSLKQQLAHVTNIYVDAANPVVWQSLKRELDEPFDQQYIKEKIECA